MTTPIGTIPTTSPLPSALDAAVHAVLQLEDDPFFNAGHGAVFTRDDLNEIKASVVRDQSSAPDVKNANGGGNEQTTGTPADATHQAEHGFARRVLREAGISSSSSNIRPYAWP
ncbi:hypothetical protein GGTG_13504 [Gaeumannomyces tritici R3-111a-1]|uniref:Uncharacterized protein n=1 Tax=Gaeumannomyces tritici (strain R3-111a-1) TaxID=644352 RepID=J3PJ22_GAET3|nr:hypothetical protein GGTG_13504 [Gaeumannomyces tritici R3-111a-1]EJT68911.1 hypothetical protein GGTG_13504 [Gaeumannomyces tritici R3-111a-1]